MKNKKLYKKGGYMKQKGATSKTKMCKKAILINGVKAVVNVPDSLLIEEEE